MELTSIAAAALALVLVLCLAWFVLKAISVSYRGALKAKHIQVVETVPLGGKDRMVLVRYQGNEYLLGVGGTGVTLVDKKPEVGNELSSSQ